MRRMFGFMIGILIGALVGSTVALLLGSGIRREAAGGDPWTRRGLSR